MTMIPAPPPSMIEKMARAAYEDWVAPVRDLEPRWEDLPESFTDRLVESQRAALLTIRVPSDAQYEALSGTGKIWRDLDSQTVWQTYIDAALEGK